MTGHPTAAIRGSGTHAGLWLLGHHPARTWNRATSAALIRDCLPDAMASLQASPEGFLVGLLPYPSSSPGDCATPARLQLFENCERALALPGTPQGHFRLTSPFTADTPPDHYLAAVGRVQAYLEAGDAYQVNLAQRFSARYEGTPWAAFRHIADTLQVPHAAWLDLGDRSLLSFSPESFLEVKSRQVATRPIKGTRPRGGNEEQDRALASQLAEATKDRAENLMIVDLLRNDLGQVCSPGSVQVPSLFRVESFHNVHHLVSTVIGTLNDGMSLVDLLLACFPGGSITGAPKRRAMEIIEELEPSARDVYCGSVFWLTADGEFGSNILIRTFLARQGALLGWAGAGIVADSKPALEQQECLDKVQSIITLFEGWCI